MLRTTFAALMMACALAACASPTSAGGGASSTQESTMRTLTAGASTQMAHGETVRLPDGATLRFVGVPQDSRCPPNARCIRAGDADIDFEYALANDERFGVWGGLSEKERMQLRRT